MSCIPPEYVKQQAGVGCYKCHSFNGSDPHCGDPFHPAYNMHRYYPKCEQGLEGRVGLFPARYCTKIKGTNQNTNEELIVRSCSIAALDNMCGLFDFGNARYSGCLMSCDLDACNSARSFLHVQSSHQFVALLTGTALIHLAFSVIGAS